MSGMNELPPGLSALYVTMCGWLGKQAGERKAARVATDEASRQRAQQDAYLRAMRGESP